MVELSLICQAFGCWANVLGVKSSNVQNAGTARNGASKEILMLRERLECSGKLRGSQQRKIPNPKCKIGDRGRARGRARGSGRRGRGKGRVHLDTTTMN